MTIFLRVGVIAGHVDCPPHGIPHCMETLRRNPIPLTPHSATRSWLLTDDATKRGWLRSDLHKNVHLVGGDAAWASLSQASTYGHRHDLSTSSLPWRFETCCRGDITSGAARNLRQQATRLLNLMICKAACRDVIPCVLSNMALPTAGWCPTFSKSDIAEADETTAGNRVLLAGISGRC